jgi:hypothetical protein
VRLRRRPSPLFLLCPICGSEAVSWAEHAGAGKGFVRWLSCCGECRTWRADVLTTQESRRVERRLAQDRRFLSDALLRLTWRDLASELRAVGRSG